MDYQIFLSNVGDIAKYMKAQNISFYEAMHDVLMNLDEKQKNIVDKDVLIPSFSKSYCAHEFPEITNTFKERDEDHIKNVKLIINSLTFQQAYSAVQFSIHYPNISKG